MTILYCVTIQNKRVDFLKTLYIFSKCKNRVWNTTLRQLKCNQITHNQDAPTITEEKQNQHYDTDSSGVDYESATDDDEAEHTLIHDDFNSDHECEEDDNVASRGNEETLANGRNRRRGS